MSTRAPVPRQPRPAPGSRASSLTLIAGLAALAVCTVTVFYLARTRSLHRQLREALHQAGTDQLTGLPNRRAALAHLGSQPVGLLGLLDLDGFKAVNDRRGHDVGDHLLSVIAARLDEAIGERGLVARLAGDEFVILWSECPHEPLREAGRVLEYTLRPLNLHGHHIAPAASLGLALPGPDLAGEDLLAAADHAMYEAKHTGIPNLYTATTAPAPIDRASSPRRSLRHAPPPEQPDPCASSRPS